MATKKNTENTEVSSLLARAQQKQADGLGDPWLPKEPGTYLEGIIEGYSSATTTHPQGLSHNIVAKVRDADGKLWSVWVMHGSLRRAFADERPAPGQDVCILYGGKQKSSKEGGAEYYDWTVVKGERPATGPIGPVDFVAGVIRIAADEIPF